MESETLILIGAVLLCLALVSVAYITPRGNAFAHLPVPNVTYLVPPTPSPTPTPRTSPTPELTPTPVPQPTPNQTPPSSPPPSSPTPKPTPTWQGLGYKCEVPQALLGEKWTEEFKFECACRIRGLYDLGDKFNVWDGCYSATSSGWRRESCECVEIICALRRDLC